jgi:hypothetical protein
VRAQSSWINSARAVHIVGCALVACLLASCGQNATSSVTTTTIKGLNIRSPVRTGQIDPPPGPAATPGPIGANPSRDHGVQLNVLSGLLHDQPIYDGDFADPYALRTPNTLYIYASSSASSRNHTAANVPIIALSRNSGFAGQFLGDALPHLPRWTVPGFQWGPAVWARPDGTYVLYYSTPATIPLGCLASPPATGCVRTAQGTTTSAACISRATATNPAGPYTDDSSSAFVCPINQGGAIDPSVFVSSNGTPYLLWKSDGDCCRKSTIIYSQQLAANGLSTVGPAHPLIGATQPWEGDLVEGPSMIQEHNDFWLFYSANTWGNSRYGIGIARCSSVIGPCTKPLDHAWIASRSDGVTDQGPGGQEFYETGPLVWMVHHGLAPGQTGDNASRGLYINLIAFPDDKLPRLAASAPAAALAEAVVYYGDPSLPRDPQSAYLQLMRKVGGSLSETNNAGLIADSSLVCRALGDGKNVGTIFTALKGRQLDTFDSDLLILLATQYQCPGRVSQATQVEVDALNQSAEN